MGPGMNMADPRAQGWAAARYNAPQYPGQGHPHPHHHHHQQGPHSGGGSGGPVQGAQHWPTNGMPGPPHAYGHHPEDMHMYGGRGGAAPPSRSAKAYGRGEGTRRVPFGDVNRMEPQGGYGYGGTVEAEDLRMYGHEAIESRWRSRGRQQPAGGAGGVGGGDTRRKTVREGWSVVAVVVCSYVFCSLCLNCIRMKTNQL